MNEEHIEHLRLTVFPTFLYTVMNENGTMEQAQKAFYRALKSMLHQINEGAEFADPGARLLQLAQEAFQRERAHFSLLSLPLDLDMNAFGELASYEDFWNESQTLVGFMDTSDFVRNYPYGSITHELDSRYSNFLKFADKGMEKLIIDPGSAPPEVIADLLSNLSIIYRNAGGSGIDFIPFLEESLVIETSEV